jgi:carbohydrate kinase (thermoresistant glucokinase family)
MVIMLMGAAGAGETTVGRQLSQELRWPFLDGDDVHPLENIAKMSRDTPLTDVDRRPWILALGKSIADASQTPERLVQTILNTWNL